MPGVSLRRDVAVAGEGGISRVKYHIAVTTLNRQTETGDRRDDSGQANYLLSTLRGLYDHAGLRLLHPNKYKVTVFDSGSLDKQFLEPIGTCWPDVAISCPGKRLNLVENTLRALESASRDSEFVCLVQDDLAFSWLSFLGINSLLHKVEENHFGYLTLVRIAGKSEDGMVLCDPDSITGACFLVFRSKDIAPLLEHSICRQWQQGFRVDYMCREWARKTGRFVFCPMESWIQHIGDYSSLREREERRVPLFSHAPVIAPAVARDTLKDIGSANISATFPDLFQSGFPAQNRRWRRDNDNENNFVIYRGREAIELNQIAAIIWELCDGTRNFDEILVQLSSEFSVAEEDIRQDVSEVLLELTEKGALCVGRNEPPTGITSLMRMISYATPEQIQEEIANHNTINFTDSLGQTAMHYAARSGRSEIVSTLLKYNPSLSVTDHAGHTPESLLEDMRSKAP